MSEKTDFQPRQEDDKGLTGGGKIIFILLSILFNPLLLLIPAYLLWHKKSPKKWTDALKIFKYIIITLVALAIFGIVISFILVSLNKARDKAREKSVSFINSTLSIERPFNFCFYSKFLVSCG